MEKIRLYKKKYGGSFEPPYSKMLIFSVILQGVHAIHRQLPAVFSAHHR